MKIIRLSQLASAAVVALLALPAAALAQPTQSPAPAAAFSPMTSQPVPGKSMEELVENHIKQLHAQLHITPAEQSQWDQFAQGATTPATWIGRSCSALKNTRR